MGCRTIPWVLLVALGCGDDGTGGPMPDASAADGGSARSIEPPMPPADPRIGPCADGWDLVGDEDAQTCEPWPATGRQSCADDEAHFVGTDGCARIGPPCPAGMWADDVPADRVVLYVSSSGSASPDGTMSAPFSTVSAATASAAPGTTIALAKGVYDETVVVPRGVELLGACVAQTAIATSVPAGADGYAVRLAADGAGVRRMRVEGEAAGILAFGAEDAIVEQVVVSGVRWLGLSLRNGSSVMARDVVVRGTRPRPDGSHGRGVDVATGAHLTLERAVIDGNRTVGAYVGDAGSSMSLSDVVIASTLGQQADLAFGIGAAVEGGASLEIARSAIEGNREYGIFVQGAGTTGLVTDSVVRDTLSQASDGSGGDAAHVLAGASAEIRRTAMMRNRYIAARAFDTGSSIVLSDVVVRDTLPDERDGALGRAMEIQDGAAGTAERAVFANNRSVGAIAWGEGTTMSLTDVRIEDVEPDGEGGRGVDAHDGAAATLTRVAVERCAYIGVNLATAGSATLTDVAIRDVAPIDLLGGGRGLNLQEGSTATVSRALIERAHEIGFYANDPGTRVDASHFVVRETQGDPIDGLAGRGMEIHGQAIVDMTDVRVENNRDIGVMVAHDGTRVSMQRVAIADTLAAACADGGCAGRGAGIGAGVYLDGYLSLRDFVLARSALAGLQLARGGEADLVDGELVDNPIGVNLQEPDYDYDRLTMGVEHRGNERNVDASALPVPDPTEPL